MADVELIEAPTLWELIVARADASPHAELAVDESGRRVTFSSYRDRVERVAAALHARGIGPGDTVTWQLPTWIESLVLVGAIARLGARQNPILHIYREREVGFCVRQTGAKLLVTPSVFGGFDFGAMADQIAAEVGGLDVLRCDRDLPEADPATLPAPPTDGGEVRWYFYTSGTTADPKGARHTDGTIAAVARGMGQRLAVTASDRNALAFPFPHIGGITWLVTGLQAGLANLLFESFVPDLVVEGLTTEGCTMAGSGTVFHQLYLSAQKAAQEQGGEVLSSVRLFPGGGAPKPPQLHYELREAFPASKGILSGYGLTEAPILTMSGTDDTDEQLAHSEGRAMPGVDLKLVTLDGAVAAVGEEGEVRAKAPQLMLGYLDASLDEAAFDEDGYFRTGDLGRLDADGFLSITGRLKDVIIRKGETISAKEVEDLLYDHPAVADVAVIGLPDESSGERVCAVVTSAGDGALEFDDMVSYLKDAGLMTQKIPEQLEVVDAIPRNPAGKILKHQLQDRYESSTPNRSR